MILINRVLVLQNYTDVYKLIHIYRFHPEIIIVGTYIKIQLIIMYFKLFCKHLFYGFIYNNIMVNNSIYSSANNKIFLAQ